MDVSLMSLCRSFPSLIMEYGIRLGWERYGEGLLDDDGGPARGAAFVDAGPDLDGSGVPTRVVAGGLPQVWEGNLPVCASW